MNCRAYICVPFPSFVYTYTTCAVRVRVCVCVFFFCFLFECLKLGHVRLPRGCFGAFELRSVGNGTFPPRTFSSIFKMSFSIFSLCPRILFFFFKLTGGKKNIWIKRREINNNNKNPPPRRGLGQLYIYRHCRYVNHNNRRWKSIGV